MKCAMRNVKCVMRKSGVSLITVLLFMLVATIAATATYKWISSEGRSSASRMQEREAYQSAMAGIENARAWMTYHANDVGALIKQYKDSGKPVKFGNNLPGYTESLRAGQQYNVWLTGVNTENSPYTLKIVSEGVARDGNARHTEVAILNVTGLYQVKIPSVKYSGDLNLNDAFFGSAKDGISLDVNSATFNGDTKFNTMFKASDYVIVTGDVNVNSNTEVGDFYVKGNLYSCTNLNVKGNAYIEEKMYVNGTHIYDGDIYAKGGIDLSKTGTGKAQCNTGYGGNITVAGNVSTEGDVKMPRHTASNQNIFNGNLVVTNGGKIDFPTLSEFNQVGSIPWITEFRGNVFLDGGFTNGWHIGYARAPYFVLGSTGKTVYSGTPLYRVSNASANIVYDHWKWNYNLIRQDAAAGKIRFINKYGEYQEYGGLAGNTYCNSQYCAPTNDFSSSYFYRNDAFYCDWANVYVGTWPFGHQEFKPTDDCGCTWATTNGKDYSGQRWKCNTDAKVKRNEIFMQINGTYVTSKPDTNGWGANRLQEYEDKITDENTGSGCGTKKHVKDPIQFNKSLLESSLMHTSAQKGACKDLTLWNSWPSPHGWIQLNSCYQKAKDADELYDDSWLMVKLNAPQWATESSDSLNGNFIIVVDGASNGLYLPKTTANSNVILYFPNGFNATINSSGGSNPMNYFIFSDGDLKNVQFAGSKMTGAVFLTDCHNMGSDQTIQIQFNTDLRDALSSSGILCNNDGTNTCSKGGSGVSSSSGSGSGSETVSFGGTDSYYISTAPQLFITLETQYANNENIQSISNDAENSSGSFIVLPRVIYLPDNPKGKLEHYYNVIPLNTKSSVESQTVTCEGSIPTNTKLYDGVAKLVEGYYKCQVTGTVNGDQSTVPFYVVVQGTDGATPKVTFDGSDVDLQKGSSTDVKLTVPNTTGASQSFNVKVYRPADIDGWTISPVNPVGSCNAKSECTFSISTNDIPKTVFTVTNNSASSGMLSFQITKCDNGCSVGKPDVKLIYVSNNMSVTRKSLADWCAENGDAADPEKCAKKNRPDCPDDDFEWVTANGTNCAKSVENDSWNCEVTGNISLNVLSANIPTGCEAVVPGDNLLTGPFNNNDSKNLYGSLKAKKQVFHAGFKTDSDIEGSQTIHILAEHNGASDEKKNCSYSNYKNEETRAEFCNIDVYYGSHVTLSFEKTSDRENFNYWLCESGVDCPSEKVPVSSYTYELAITGENTVHAHYNEKDKHCFFDEFKEKESYLNRTSLECGEGTEYCIDNCSGTCSDAVTGSYSKAKWRLIDGDLANIQFSGDGKISLKSNTTRGRKENAKGSATVMSTVQAGLYGTLKVQIQVPRQGVTDSDEGKATVKQSGFMLRSNANGDSYLMLNIFSDNSGNLKARICVNGSSTCKENRIGMASVNEGSIVTISATLGKIENSDKDGLEVRAYSNPFSSTYQTTTFELSNSNLSGVETLAVQTNEFFGVKLSDQNFKIYGIGWKSDDYASECWDTYPTLSCSFKAAYTGGIVPQGKAVAPWVGLSSWFENAGGCTPKYYYKGSDAGCYGSVAETDYRDCGSSYNFTESGPHGTTADGDKTAKAGVEGCQVYGEAAAWANSAVAAHCGAFWVGDFKNCSKNVTFGQTVSGAEGSFFALDAYGTESANLRDADLLVTLDNPNGAEVSVYLFSKNSTSGYSYGADPVYSQSYITTKKGTNFSISIPVANIANVEGFDPEHVMGAYVKYDDGSINVRAVQSRCQHVLSLTSCSAKWDGNNKRFEITAVVKNGSTAKEFEVTETSSYISGKVEKDCEQGQCSWTGDNTTFLWEFNAYKDINDAAISERDYAFRVKMEGEDGEADGSPCVTSTVKVTRIASTCSINKNSVKQGEKLPIFTYSIAGCPTNSTGCPYEIKLQNQGTTLVTGNSGNVSNLVTNSDAANTSEEPLAVGTYKFVMKSTDVNTPFADCIQEFIVQEPASSSSEESSSSAVSSSSVIQSATCNFEKNTYEWFENLTKVKINNPNSRDYHGISWKTTWIREGQTEENDISSGTLNCNNNSICEISINGSDNSGKAQPGVWQVYLGGATSPSCFMTLSDGNGLPPMKASNCKLNNGATQLAASQTAQFDANMTKCNGSACNWYIKKDGTKVSEGTFGDQLHQNITGPGIYTVHLLSESASAACTVTITEKSPASNCRHNATSRTYGDNHQFQAKLTVASGTSYQILGPGGEEIESGTFSQTYSDQDWNSSQFHAKISGKYKLKIGDSEVCETNNTLTVTQPTAENCKLDANPISSGGSTTFRWDLKNCKDNQCSYEIKLDGSYFYGESNVGEQNDRQRTVSTAGEYVVWLNGVATNCKKTLTVAASGSLTCSIAENLAVDDQWQKIKVSSTRLKGQYDVWIDGSIGDDSNGNPMTGIWIEKDATNVDVGGFTCTTSGPHTYKITATGSSTSLCNGSFNCLNVPKVDCYFLYNSNWSSVSGSVLPETQLQFCTSQAAFGKQTTLTGTKKSGPFSKTDYYLSKDGQVCYYFEAPSSDGSYTFSVSANGEEACNNTPVLEVEMPANAITLTYGGSLTTINAGTWSVFSDNQNSGVLRCKATENVDITVNGTSKTVTTSLNSIDGANPRPTVAVTVTVPTGKSIQCHTNW